LKADDIEAGHRGNAPVPQEQAQQTEAKRQLVAQLKANDPAHAKDDADRMARGKQFSSLISQGIKSKVLTPKSLGEVIRSLRMTPLQRAFQHMDWQDANDVWKLTSDQEKKDLRPMFAKKFGEEAAKGGRPDPKLLR
jgi:hypothetical protein